MDRVTKFSLLLFVLFWPFAWVVVSREQNGFFGSLILAGAPVAFIWVALQGLKWVFIPRRP